MLNYELSAIKFNKILEKTKESEQIRFLLNNRNKYNNSALRTLLTVKGNNVFSKWTLNPSDSNTVTHKIKSISENYYNYKI